VRRRRGEEALGRRGPAGSARSRPGAPAALAAAPSEAVPVLLVRPVPSRVPRGGAGGGGP
jgi:hypothetical protein